MINLAKRSLARRAARLRWVRPVSAFPLRSWGPALGVMFALQGSAIADEVPHPRVKPIDEIGQLLVTTRPETPRIPLPRAAP